MKSVFYIILFATLAMLSCEHNVENNSVTSECIVDKIQIFKSNLEAKAVLSYKLDGKVYYWFNTDATHYDGVEYIYGEDCMEACYFCGECAYPPCNEKFPYDKSNWEIVWQK
jgi:hypothetical protein